MPGATAQARRNGAARQQQAPRAPGVIIPFTAASHEHTEPFFDSAVTPGASAALLGNGPIDIPAYGYIRHVYLEVVATGGALGAGVLSADYPFNLFDLLQVEDTNGAPIHGPMNGWQVLYDNIIGAYAGRSDPRLSPSFVGTINSTFYLRIPIEISHRDGFGALANQNAAAPYRLRMRVNPSSVLYSTAPTTVPSFRVRAYLEAWSLPEEHDVRGRPQEQLPPGHGTTQYWSASQVNVNAGGNQRIPLTRVGNLLRNIIFEARTQAAGTPRSDAVFPDPCVFSWDARDIRNDTQGYLTNDFFESLPALSARDAGMFEYAFDHSDHNMMGDDAPTFWLPTVQSSRIEFRGNVVTAGSVGVLVNDIAPVEVVPSERFVEESATGFHPNPDAAPVTR